MRDYTELEKFSRARQEPRGCHGYDHTERVIKLCEVIGIEYNADMAVLAPAAILHDIGRPNADHASHSAAQARNILMEKVWGLAIIDGVVHAIEVHSFSAGGEAITLEARILSDADKLDAMGAVGVYRAAQYAVEKGRPIEDFIDHFHEKLLKLKDMLYTDKAKEMAAKRHEFMLSYLEQIGKELKGLI